MRGAHSISMRRAYGVQRVCRVWHCARSSVYARRQATSPGRCRRRGPIPPDGFRIVLPRLREAGFSQDEIDIMTKRNPARFLGLEPW